MKKFLYAFLFLVLFIPYPSAKTNAQSSIEYWKNQSVDQAALTAEQQLQDVKFFDEKVAKIISITDSIQSPSYRIRSTIYHEESMDYFVDAIIDTFNKKEERCLADIAPLLMQQIDKRTEENPIHLIHSGKKSNLQKHVESFEYTGLIDGVTETQIFDGPYCDCMKTIQSTLPLLNTSTIVLNSRELDDKRDGSSIPDRLEIIFDQTTPIRERKTITLCSTN